MNDSDRTSALRRIPKIDALARHPALDGVRMRLGEATLTALARAVAAEARGEVLLGAQGPDLAQAVARVRDRAEALLGSRIRRVINASGVLLHTNLGRAPLSPKAAAAAAEVGARYASLEIDLVSGARGPRGAFAERALCQLTGAEAALVVNNNAAAVLLGLTALARGKAVVVSRGELVEIGGGFRVPEVLLRSGAAIVEVGTTNKTRLSDYQRALDENPDVAAILSVHPGNFRMSGFVERPALSELCALARARGLPLIDDLGGGALVDLGAFAGLSGEPTAQQRIAQGAPLCCFSCDKALGGPQAGAVVGRADLVERLRADPLARALRLGPLPLAALEATLTDYLNGRYTNIPALAALSLPVADVRARVERWCARLAEQGVLAEPVLADGRVGGGTFAEEPLPSCAAWLKCDDIDATARGLRAGDPAVLPHVADGRLLLDGRTVLPDEDDALIAAVAAAARGKG